MLLKISVQQTSGFLFKKKLLAFSLADEKTDYYVVSE